MPKVSIIIPAYNAEKVLARCLDSVLAQTFTDFEVLVMDDDTTVRGNRLRLLNRFTQVFEHVADIGALSRKK